VSARRKNVSFQDEVIARAKEVMKVRAIKKFSKFLETVILEEWERRKGENSSLERRLAIIEQAIAAGSGRIPDISKPESGAASPPAGHPSGATSSPSTGPGKPSHQVKARRKR
jgi:hypothetical protein